MAAAGECVSEPSRRIRRCGHRAAKIERYELQLVRLALQSTGHHGAYLRVSSMLPAVLDERHECFHGSSRRRDSNIKTRMDTCDRVSEQRSCLRLIDTHGGHHDLWVPRWERLVCDKITTVGQR
jgi:hypothetical protein